MNTRFLKPLFPPLYLAYISGKNLFLINLPTKFHDIAVKIRLDNIAGRYITNPGYKLRSHTYLKPELYQQGSLKIDPYVKYRNVNQLPTNHSIINIVADE